MKFLRFIILLTILLTESHIDNAKETAAYYLHPEDLMPLVHGEFRGTLLWLWDACCCQHPIVTSLCVVTATTFTICLATPLIKKFRAWRKWQHSLESGAWRVKYLQMTRDCWIRKQT